MQLKSVVRQFIAPELNRSFVIRLACVALSAYLLFGHVLRPMRISGDSMYPTYRDGGINFCNLWRYRFSPPSAGDVVMVRFTGNRIMLLKRVVATAGQTVEFRDGWLVVDGETIEEPYIVGPCDWQLAPREVRSGHVYVVGDNRSVSIERHDFGQTPLSQIAGGPLW